MPYQVVKRGDKWQTINSETGDVKGTHSSKESAVKQLRLLYMVEGGKKPTGAKSTME